MCTDSHATNAPVAAAAKIEIDAPVAAVWDVLTDIENWPAWNPDVSEASMSGALGEGADFRWKAGPGSITSTIERLAPPHAITWSGRTFGVRALHRWRLEECGTGTRASSEEAFNGLIARVFHRPLQKTLDDALTSGLRHLKAEAERQTRHAGRTRTVPEAVR